MEGHHMHMLIKWGIEVKLFEKINFNTFIVQYEAFTVNTDTREIKNVFFLMFVNICQIIIFLQNFNLRNCKDIVVN